MSDKISLFEYPEFNETFNDLFGKLLNESGRGAILIGTTCVEDHLDNFILRILPKNSKTYTSRLLKYPGPLGTFSGKIELLFAFRLITERFYKALNSLRKIRNMAAHSSNDFNLADTKIDEIFNIGDGFRTLIHESSMNLMLNVKLDNINESLKEIEDLDTQEVKEFIASKLQDKNVLAKLENQLPHWKLIMGLSVICGMLRFYSDSTVETLNDCSIWSQVKIKNDA